MKVEELFGLSANDGYNEVDFYDEEHQITETVTEDNLYSDICQYAWNKAEVVYWFANFEAGVLQVSAVLPDSDIKSSRNFRSKKSVMASAWRAPNGKKYGKQTRRFPGKYLFTRRELRDMVDSGIATDMAGTFDPMAMNYDIIGIAWNETNGHRSGILIEDRDTGELYVGNTADAGVAKL